MSFGVVLCNLDSLCLGFSPRIYIHFLHRGDFERETFLHFNDHFPVFDSTVAVGGNCQSVFCSAMSE